MNIHKNARLTFARRLEMVQDVLERRLSRAAAAARARRERADGAQVARPLPGQGEAGLARRIVAAAGQPRAIAPEHGAGDRRAAPALPDPGAHRAQHSGCPKAQSAGSDARRPVALVATRAGRAGGALRASAAGRSAAHRHQEARAHRAHGHRVTGDPRDQRRRRRLGVPVRGGR